MGNDYGGYIRSAPPNDWSLTEKLRALRTLHGYTQEDLAVRAAEYLPSGLRLSRRGISGLEKGNDPEFSWPNGTYMHAVHIIAIATALGVPPSYLDSSISDNPDIEQLRTLLGSIDLNVEAAPRVVVKDETDRNPDLALHESGNIPDEHGDFFGIDRRVLNGSGGPRA